LANESLDGEQLNEPRHLLDRQYANASNLNARIAIHERFSTNHYGWQRFVFDHLLRLPPDAKILELGCGSAALWCENIQRVPANWHVTLTDFSPGMLEQAQTALLAVSPGDARFAFQTADAQSLPFAAGAFDAVIANHMLYHVPDVPATIAEVRRVLVANGTFFAATNGEEHMGEQWALVARYKSQPGNSWHTVLMRAFSLQNGEALLRAQFAHVACHDYPDALIVTEVEPLVAYVASMNLVPMEELDAFAAFLQAEMETRGGEIRINKQTGLFVAS